MEGGSPDAPDYPAPTFIYKPLNLEAEEVRFVQLLPGDFNDDLRIRIVHAPFITHPVSDSQFSNRLEPKALQKTLPDGWAVRETIEGRFLFISSDPSVTTWTHPDPHFDAEGYTFLPVDPLDGDGPQHEALSYTWGLDTDLQTLRVLPEQPSVQEEESYLQIRPTLETALRYLRKTDVPRKLWIDAICINQQDTAERDLQIKRMGGIYRRAKRVLIWIGPESRSSSLAVNTLRHLGQQVEHAVDSWYPSPDGADRHWSDPRFDLPYDQDTWSSLAEILSRPFFQRVWVMQEARLARHALLQCGVDTVPWNLFRRAIITLREKPSIPKHMAGLVDEARELCNSRYQSDFFWLMLMSRKHKCADPRDKLYGVLSLISPRLAQDITPRYDKPCIDVYREAMLAYCEIGGRLDILSHVNSATTSWTTATWVPDWWQGVDNTLQTTFFAPAAGISRAFYHLADSSRLRVRGKSIGRVCRVESAVQGANNSIFEVWKHIQPLDGDDGPSSSGINRLLEPFLDLILINSTRERYPTNLSYPSLAEFRDKYLEELDRGVVSLGQLPEVRPARLLNLSFILTSDDRLGLAPTQTESGDIVCVFLGCHLPMVLRPLPQGYKLLGPGLVHGMIDGEGVLGDLPRPWRVQFYRDNLGYAKMHFRNTETGELTVEDPRLGRLPSEWERLDRKRSTDDPRWFAYFRNRVTGEVMNSDPRMLPDALAARDVRLETFELV